MQIAIVGAGAIGCLFGIRLHQSGQKVLLIHHRRKIANQLERSGLVLKESTGKIIRARIPTKRALSGDDHPDLVILAVKAYDTLTASLQIRDSLDHVDEILSVQNGLGNAEIISHLLPETRVLAGTTTEAALQTGPGRISHMGTGETWIGEPRKKPTKRTVAIKRVLQRAGFETSVSSNIEGVIWSKAIVNSAVNPISAIARVKNGELLRNPDLKQAALKLVNEGCLLARTVGILPQPVPYRMLLQVLAKTSRNRSSMLQDIEAGKKTEIRQLNGVIVALGRRHEVDVSCNAIVVMLIQGLERIAVRMNRQI